MPTCLLVSINETVIALIRESRSELAAANSFQIVHH